MERNLSSLEGYVLSTIYFLSPFMMLNEDIGFDHSVWVVLPLAGMISILIGYLYIKILKKKSINNALTIALLSMTILALIYSFVTFLSFSKVCVSTSTPIIIIFGFMIILVLWAGFKDLKIIGICGKNALIFVLLLLIIMIAVPLLRVNMINIDSLIKFDYNFIKQIIIYTCISSFNIIILVTLYKLSEQKFNITKICLRSLGLASILLSIIFLASLLLLGDNFFDMLSFPIYYSLGVVAKGKFFARIEIISLAVIIFIEFFNLVLLFQFLKYGCRYYSNNNNLKKIKLRS